MSNQKIISPWNYKPWWCQPWSIILTGITIVCGSWILIKSFWITAFISIPVAVWMGYFLLIWPKLVLRNSSSHYQQKQDNVSIFNQSTVVVNDTKE